MGSRVHIIIRYQYCLPLTSHFWWFAPHSNMSIWKVCVIIGVVDMCVYTPWLVHCGELNFTAVTSEYNKVVCVHVGPPQRGRRCVDWREEGQRPLPPWRPPPVSPLPSPTSNLPPAANQTNSPTNETRATVFKHHKPMAAASWDTATLQLS